MSTDAVDYLKFAAALIVVAQGEFLALHVSGSPAAVEAALARLHHVHAEMSDAAGRFCPDGQSAETWLTRYDDGRPVMSAMPMGGGCYAHAWHPDRTHPMNNRPDLGHFSLLVRPPVADLLILVMAGLDVCTKSRA